MTTRIRHIALPTKILASCLAYAGGTQWHCVCKFFAELAKEELKSRAHIYRALFTSCFPEVCTEPSSLKKNIKVILELTAIYSMYSPRIGPHHILGAYKAWNLLIFLGGLRPYIPSAKLTYYTEMRKFHLCKSEAPALRRQQLEETGKTISQWMQEHLFELSTIRKAEFLHKMFFVPPEVRYLSGLEELRVETPVLLKLDSSIGSLGIHLKKLSLRGNYLNELPKSFSFLQELRELHLDCNIFKEVPLVICALRKLKYFTISSNLIKDFPKESSQWEQLTHIDFSYNLCKEMPHALSHCKRLRFINAQHNLIEGPLSLMTSFPVTQMIDLTGNPLAGLTGPFRFYRTTV